MPSNPITATLRSFTFSGAKFYVQANGFGSLTSHAASGTTVASSASTEQAQARSQWESGVASRIGDRLHYSAMGHG